MQIFLQASEPSDLTYMLDTDFLELDEVLRNMQDDPARKRLISAIERAESNHVEVSEETLSAFMDAVSRIGA